MIITETAVYGVTSMDSRVYAGFVLGIAGWAPRCLSGHRGADTDALTPANGRLATNTWLRKHREETHGRDC